MSNWKGTCLLVESFLQRAHKKLEGSRGLDRLCTCKSSILATTYTVTFTLNRKKKTQTKKTMQAQIINFLNDYYTQRITGNNKEVTDNKISVYYIFNKSDDDRYMLIKEKRILDGLAQKYLVDFGWETECNYLVYEADEWWSFHFNGRILLYIKKTKNEEKKEEEDVNVGCSSSFYLII